MALPAEAREYFLVLGRYGHGIVRIYAVLLEVVWESTKEELVENAALLDVQVVRSFVVSPIG